MALAVPGENLPRNDERYHILVASPGKLHELIRNLNQDTTQFFEYTTYLVVDEADHILREEKDGADLTLQILRQLRPDIQMLYFTATWDENLPREIGKVFKSNCGSRVPWMNRLSRIENYPNACLCAKLHFEIHVGCTVVFLHSV